MAIFIRPTISCNKKLNKFHCAYYRCIQCDYAHDIQAALCLLSVRRPVGIK